MRDMRKKPDWSGSRTMLFAAVLLMLLAWLQQPAAAATEPYGDYHWKPAETMQAGPLPQLLEHERVEAVASGVVFVEGRVIWATSTQAGEQKVPGFLMWEPASGSVRRVSNWQHGRVLGMAYNPAGKELLIRTAAFLLLVDPHTFAVTRKVPFVRATAWRDMTVAGNKLVILAANGKDLYLHDLRTFEVQQTYPTGLEKIQRISRLRGDQVVLWSSYWGSRLHLADLETGVVSKAYHVHGGADHAALFKLTTTDDGRLAVFDPFRTKRMELLVFTGNAFVPLAQGSQVTSNGLGWRVNPRTNRLDGHLKMTASVDMPATELLLVLPARSTYHQELAEESFPHGGQITVDSYGNRSLRLLLPPLKAGESYSKTYYSARLTRYQVLFYLPGLTGSPSNPPQELGRYLENRKVYDLEHPLISETLRTLVPKNAPAPETVQSVYRFAVGIPYGKGFEPAPAAIVKRSGGCTEHSYIQVALLRKAGIPARFVWNSISDRNGLASFDHKYAEAWLPGLGWVPLEPLAGRRDVAGSLVNYPLVFSVMDHPWHEHIANGDMLASFTKPFRKFWKLSQVSVAWTVGDRP